MENELSKYFKDVLPEKLNVRLYSRLLPNNEDILYHAEANFYPNCKLGFVPNTIEDAKKLSKLISASPIMLVALKSARAFILDNSEGNKDSNYFKIVECAINAAEK